MKWTALQNIAASTLVLTALAGLSSGCQVTHTQDHATVPGKSATAATLPKKGGAQLWAENCNRCHNTRSPASYSDTQWIVAMHHMRLRAGLTAEEHREILKFLQSAN